MFFSQISHPDIQHNQQEFIYYESPQLKSLHFLIHAFTTRKGGVSEGCYNSLNFSVKEGDPEENVRKNFQVVADAFNLSPQQFLTVKQVHGDNILMIDDPAFIFHSCKPFEYDCIITNRPGLAIGVKTADCVPILLVDHVKRVIGVIHAGWRGTVLNIAAKAVAQFQMSFSSKTQDLLAAIGPAIGPCCYQVDRQVYDAVSADVRNLYFQPCKEKNRWMFDLPFLNRQQLIAAGMLSEKIDMSGLCTSCLPGLFYSHRGEYGKTGRQFNFLMLKDHE